MSYTVGYICGFCNPHCAIFFFFFYFSFLHKHLRLTDQVYALKLSPLLHPAPRSHERQTIKSNYVTSICIVPKGMKVNNKWELLMLCTHTCPCELKWGCVNTRRRWRSEEPQFLTKENLIGSTWVALCSSLGWFRGGYALLL